MEQFRNGLTVAVAAETSIARSEGWHNVFRWSKFLMVFEFYKLRCARGSGARFGIWRERESV